MARIPSNSHRAADAWTDEACDVAPAAEHGADPTTDVELHPLYRRAKSRPETLRVLALAYEAWKADPEGSELCIEVVEL